MKLNYANFIDGNWDSQAETYFTLLNPATEEEIGSAPCASETQVLKAIQASQKGMQEWKSIQPWKRSEILRKIADLLVQRKESIANSLTVELGKPLDQSRGEVQLAVDQFIWYSEETKRIIGQTYESRLPDSRILIDYEPVGVVASFTAWNFPVILAARKIAPALAARCGVVCYPSFEGSASVAALIECCQEAGLPRGVLNMVMGHPQTVSDTLVASPQVRLLSLTGSIRVGKILMQGSSETLKRVLMELGGHGPVIAFKDVNVSKLARTAAQVKFKCAGQVCVSPSRYYIQEEIYDEFCKCFVEETQKLKIGNGLKEETELGPLTTQKRYQEILELIEKTKTQGGELLCGGKRPEALKKGFFVEPTVFKNLPKSADLMKEEPFGPVVPITSFREESEAVFEANNTFYGLAAYVFSGSTERAFAVAQKIESGMVGVNQFALANAEVPFGGIKESGFGREGGSQGIYDYLETKYYHLTNNSF